MSAINSFKDGLRTALYHCGALGAVHRWRNRKALTVLMFHRVLPEEEHAFSTAEREFTFTLQGFRQTLDFVQRHYRVVSLEALDAARLGRAPLPRNPLLITFDDGWRDTLTHALPELRGRSLPAVLFVASEVTELDSARWWQDALVAAMAQPGAHDRLCTAAGWQTAPPGGLSQALAAHLASKSESERRAWLAQHAPEVKEVPKDRQMVTLADLKSVHSAPLSIGGHGHTHSPLTLSPHPVTELETSQRLLDELNQGARSMSFPHGAYTNELVSHARASGFDWIFTSDATLGNIDSLKGVPPALGRIHVPENIWTCRHSRIDPARLATFLFFRPMQSHRIP